MCRRRGVGESGAAEAPRSLAGGTLGDEGMDTPESEATAQPFGLAHGYLTVDDVIAWADDLILRLPTVPPEIIEIATSPNRVDELERRLHACVGSFEKKPDRSWVLKSMSNTLPAFLIVQVRLLVRWFRYSQATRSTRQRRRRTTSTTHSNLPTTCSGGSPFSDGRTALVSEGVELILA
jgi:hypothetical protein